jgi:hypothetical protein
MQSLGPADFDVNVLQKQTTNALAMHDPPDIRIINALPFSNAASSLRDKKNGDRRNHAKYT